jgi:acetyltransferase-like isoleucine patch superfamily enzyme
MWHVNALIFYKVIAMRTQILKKILNLFFPNLIKINKQNNSHTYLSNSTISSKSKNNPPYNLQDSFIDDYSYVDENSMILFAKIGKFCSIGPNFFCGWGIHPTTGISTSPMFYSTKKQNGYTLSITDKIEERKKITIGNDVFIGANVTVLDGITIGDGAIIGAGAVVSKDIPAYAVAVGSPIQILKYRFTEEQIEKLLKIKWWDFQDEKLQDIERMFFDVDSFISKYAS